MQWKRTRFFLPPKDPLTAASTCCVCRSPRYRGHHPPKHASKTENGRDTEHYLFWRLGGCRAWLRARSRRLPLFLLGLLELDTVVFGLGLRRCRGRPGHIFPLAQMSSAANNQTATKIHLGEVARRVMGRWRGRLGLSLRLAQRLINQQRTFITATDLTLVKSRRRSANCWQNESTRARIPSYV